MSSKKNLIIIFLCCIIVYVFYRENYYNRIKDKIFPSEDIAQEDSLEILYSQNQYNHNIIMLGDSLTESAKWNELLGLNISNKGRSGDTSMMILSRLNYVLDENPDDVFLLVGVNDIYRGIEIDKTLKNIETIITVLKKNGIRVHVQSVINVGKTQSDYIKKNKLINKLNDNLKVLVQKEKLDYINLNISLSQKGLLIDNFTTDGVHLNADGYEAWTKIVFEKINKLGYYN